MQIISQRHGEEHMVQKRLRHRFSRSGIGTCRGFTACSPRANALRIAIDFDLVQGRLRVLLLIERRQPDACVPDSLDLALCEDSLHIAGVLHHDKPEPRGAQAPRDQAAVLAPHAGVGDQNSLHYAVLHVVLLEQRGRVEAKAINLPDNEDAAWVLGLQELQVLTQRLRRIVRVSSLDLFRKRVLRCPLLLPLLLRHRLRRCALQRTCTERDVDGARGVAGVSASGSVRGISAHGGLLLPCGIAPGIKKASFSWLRTRLLVAAPTSTSRAPTLLRSTALLRFIADDIWAPHRASPFRQLLVRSARRVVGAAVAPWPGVEEAMLRLTSVCLDQLGTVGRQHAGVEQPVLRSGLGHRVGLRRSCGRCGCRRPRRVQRRVVILMAHLR
mmetsp:Transcript_21114/g.53951  ORF Transcript_21114/g.53951 Transcript_21114/m.53951 type:complete len:385 (-) Transcript_21114:1693-2847(-)